MRIIHTYILEPVWEDEPARGDNSGGFQFYYSNIAYFKFSFTAKLFDKINYVTVLL